MAKLVLFGAGGFVGSRILTEALRRGHEMTAADVDVNGIRSGDASLTVRSGALYDASFVEQVSAGADVIVIAVPAESTGGKRLLDAVPTLVTVARSHNLRLGVVGGAGSLLATKGGPRLLDTPDFPGVSRSSSESHAEVLGALRATESDVDWFYVSPATMFGPHFPGQRFGNYRVGDDVQLTDDEGVSALGGEDFAIAFVDEIERPAHHRARFTVAY